MPLTIMFSEGDGVTDDQYKVIVSMPDSGTSVLVQGTVQLAGQAVQAITGSPLTAPAPPASGLIYWNIQVDGTTGAATIQQNTVSQPLAINGNNRIVFNQVLAPAQTDPALVATDSTPDVPAGSN